MTDLEKDSPPRRWLPNPWVAFPVLVAAVAAFLIGRRVAAVGCESGCLGLELGVGIISAVVAAGGVLVVVVLALRSLAEWSQGQRQAPDPGDEPPGPPTC